MRSFFAIPVLAVGLVCLTRPLPAQLNSVQPFNSFTGLLTEPGATGSRIGVFLRDIDADRASVLKLGSVSGVEVTGVQAGSPAEQAGIKAGDVLLSYNSESIIGAQQLGRLVAETPVGRKVKIEYFRDGKVTTVTVTTARPMGAMTLTGEPTAFPRNVGGLNELLLPGSFPTARFLWTNPQMGIECEVLNSHDSEPQLAEFFGVKHGVLIRSVVKDSPAAKAGMRAGDVVTQIGDHAVADPKDLASYTRQEHYQPKPIAVEVVREHKPLTLKLNLTPDSQE
jgi:serine protease Do